MNIDNSITLRQPNELLRIILYDNCKFKDNVNKWNFDCDYPIHQK